MNKVIIIGSQGSGKTTLAKYIASSLHAFSAMLPDQIRVVDDDAHEMPEKIKYRCFSEDEASEGGGVVDGPVEIHVFNEDQYRYYGRYRETVTEKMLNDIDSVTDVATSPGNAFSNDYMLGMANGLILAQSILKEIEPTYLTMPDKFAEVGAVARADEQQTVTD